MPQNNILLRDSYYRLTIKMRARAAVPFTLSRRRHLTFTNTKFSPIIVCCDTKIVLTSWLKGLVSWSSLLLCQRQRWHVWVSEATHIICLGLKQLKRNSCPFSLRLGESRRKKKTCNRNAAQLCRELLFIQQLHNNLCFKPFLQLSVIGCYSVKKQRTLKLRF